MSAGAQSAIDEFLEQEQHKELLRFTTAGSVDDGKSTLIGRLLYDSKGVYEDQLASVKKASVNRSAGPIDFSLLTDGLKAEREQGITIDVAYRYFTTPKRKFIIADTPGHEQYTRNMATGASTAQLAIVLVDARKGVLPQSRRHAFIASLLAIPHVVVAVNKMDLVEYSEEVFDRICRDFREFARDLHLKNVYFLPISALEGDNVVSNSPRTPWYRGGSLLHILETVPIDLNFGEDMRFPVQYVVRPTLDFRGYAGQVASGVIQRGDAVMVLPSGRTSKVKSIVTFDGNLAEAYAPQSVTVCLEDEVDISRGDMLVKPSRMPHVSRRFEATVVWMASQPMNVDQPYLVKHTSHQVRAQITRLHHRVSIDDLSKIPAERLELNEIGVVSVETHRPLFFDPYTSNRTTGAFILIDPVSNLTVGAGMIAERAEREDRKRGGLAGVEFERSRLTAAERWERAGHRPVTIWLTARTEVAYLLERELFDRGCMVHVIADDVESHLLPELAKLSSAAGLITICTSASDEQAERERARDLVGSDQFFDIDPQSLSTKDIDAKDQIAKLLEARGIIRPDDRGIGGDGI
ncbi:MAG TPA: sulfate adenylyltransferase subunit CysN [Bryobacteraceae bacterium]|nr:sulfate adenylyltransferase subunit CysN [Bryobacteraceae bacterium]